MLKRANRRSAPRSRTGCLNCRKKRVKCDEARPSCGQCRKANQSCRILDSIFRPHPYTFVVPGNEADEDRQSGDEQAGLNYSPNSPDAVISPQANRRNGHFNVGESNAASTGRIVEVSVEHSRVWNDAVLDDNAQHIDSLQQSPAQRRPSPAITTASPGLDSDVELPHFIRCYADSLAKGLDAFSEDSYFTHRVLVLSRDSALVRFAACAAAAKQLGHTRQVPENGSKSKSQQLIRKIRNSSPGGHNFLWYGAKYYGKAIQAMAAEISDHPITGLDLSSSSVTEQATSPGSQQDSTEARLVAVALMSMYEELSASWKAWSRHVDGMFQLLRLDNVETTIGSTSSPLPTLGMPRSMKSLFWSFVRNDMEESFFTSRQTRVSTEAFHLWREMGIPLDARGDLIVGCFVSSGSHNVEHMALRSITWLFSRTVNYIATKVRSSSSPDTATLLSPGVLERNGDAWGHLEHGVTQWRSELPLSFQPDVVVPRRENNGRVSRVFVHEVWFSNDACAMAMIYYYTLRILLSLHKPAEGVTNAAARPDWLEFFRTLRHELEQHARNLLTIVAGRPSDAVRLHLLQPLYIAGRCLEEENDQRELVTLLKSLEQDLGIATGYRVEALVREWGNPAVYGASQLDAELSDLSSDD